MKRNKRKNNYKFLIITILIILIFSICNVTHAKTIKDGIELEIYTDKENYTKQEEIVTTIEVKNTNTYDIYNLNIEAILPEGVELKDSSSKDKTIDLLRAGKSETLKFTLCNQNTSNVKLPNTGVKQWVGIAVVIFSLILILSYKNNKRIGKLFTLVIAMGILCSSQNELFAKNIEKSLEDERTITIENNQCKIYAKVKYDIEIASEDIPENQDEPEKTDEETKRLSDVVEVGDYVNYDANSGLVTPLTYTTDSTLTGHSAVSTYSSSDSVKWRVLSVDKDKGKIELIAASNLSSLALRGIIGYVNAEDILNDIGAVYGHGKGAIGGRSINIEDIERYSSYDPEKEYKNSYSSTGTVGGTRTYPSGIFIKGEGITGGTEDPNDPRVVIASSTNEVTVTQTAYGYSNPSNYFENQNAYNVLLSGRNDFWLASRYRDLGSIDCYFGVHCAISGDFYCDFLFGSESGNFDNNLGVVPVVSLDSDIPTSGKDTNGAWNLKVE